jgi:hypothetical protein
MCFLDVFLACTDLKRIFKNIVLVFLFENILK